MPRISTWGDNAHIWCVEKCYRLSCIPHWQPIWGLLNMRPACSIQSYWAFTIYFQDILLSPLSLNISEIDLDRLEFVIVPQVCHYIFPWHVANPFFSSPAHHPPRVLLHHHLGCDGADDLNPNLILQPMPRIPTSSPPGSESSPSQSLLDADLEANTLNLNLKGPRAPVAADLDTANILPSEHRRKHMKSAHMTHMECQWDDLISLSWGLGLQVLD